MKKVFKILKWTLKLTIGFLALIIVAGLGVRIFGPTSHGPTGELIDIGGIDLHIHATGEKNNKPTLVVEGGRGTPTVYYHWLSEGLKDHIRIVRYDRAGLGYSDRSEAPRTPEFIAQELHQLLENAGEKPPYILMGHSLGGNYARVFTELYPDEVSALFLLDSTHPNRVQKIPSTPSRSSWKFKLVTAGETLQAILGDLGVLALYDILTGPAFGRDMEGVPDEITDRTLDLLLNGKHFRTMADETLGYHETLARAGEKTDFGTLPIRIVPSAIWDVPEETYQSYLKAGMDLREREKISRELQKDYLNLSTDSKLIEVDGDHNTIFTKKENAELICGAVIELLNEE